MAEKGMFVKFMSAIKKHFKQKYPFVRPMEQSFNASMPKSCTFYLGVSPKYQKHVILNFSHSPKPWSVGEFTVDVHISTEYKVTDNWDAPLNQYESFADGLFNIPNEKVADSHIVKTKVWCLKPTSSVSGNYTEYWRPTSYDNEESVINDVIVDVCAMLEQVLFRKAGFIE